MKAKNKFTSMKERLGELTKNMDIPSFRKIDVKWLIRNIGVRNTNHENYPEAMEILEELSRAGVH